MKKEAGLISEIKLINRPEQKGDGMADYWVAIYQGNIAGGETKEEAKQNLLNILKELH